MARLSRYAFTLVELLVVLAVIGILVGLLMPAIQAAREAARRMSCSNNLRQMGIALHNYESAFGRLPPGGVVNRTGVSDSWSFHARLLPFIEQAQLQNLIDWNLPYAMQSQVASTRVPIFLCPSDPNDRRRLDPQPSDPTFAHHPLCYGVNMGEWFVFDPRSNLGGTGLVFPNSRTSISSVLDGTSGTLSFSEVKAWAPYLRDGGTPSLSNVPAPNSPASIAALGGNFKQDSGHTEWVDFRSHQTGFTTTLTPNTLMIFPYGGKNYDVDFNSSREGKTSTLPTYAAITSRSYHVGGVQSGFVDGSVHFIANSIDFMTWRALGTRNGSEVVQENYR
ncbi:MAG: DUF1559 domain-containing protein [Planctomycetes bacterium]|nr:DUF1559 domain-containing protein [Planctomycetota bacterium]